VTNDEWDTRVPLHPDEAFANGIHFQAKVSAYIVSSTITYSGDRSPALDDGEYDDEVLEKL
jgi:hypothetical protein